MNKNQKTRRSRGFAWMIGSGLLLGAAALLTTSCAKDGFNEEQFVSPVTNSQLASPTLTKQNFSTQIATDGSERILVAWDVVLGAGGYEYAAYNVDDPANPIELAKGVADGAYFSFPKAEDTKYQVSVKTLGNKKLNNTDAPEATTFAYSTMIDAKIIPAGQDIAEFIKANLTNSEEEQAFELEAGATYTCNSSFDFMDNKMTLRGSKVNHPVVVMGEEAVIYTSSQLKLKFINFDCSAMTNKWGVIEMSPEPPATKSAEAQGIGAGKGGGKPADVYVLMDPIIIQDCAFKNVPNCFFSVGTCSWGIADLRVLNSVIQLNNDGSKNANGSLFSAYSSEFKSPSGGQFWSGCIRNITVKESTIYNSVSNSKCFTIRFNNKDLDRVFPTADGSANFFNNTFIKVFDGKNFADRTPNQAKYIISYDNNVFVDCFRLQKFILGNCTVNHHKELNTGWGIKNSLDGTDKEKWVTEEDPGIAESEMAKELDFSQPMYGINFKASGTISRTIGDPRWLD